MNSWIARVSVPSTIILDRATQFTSDLWAHTSQAVCHRKDTHTFILSSHQWVGGMIAPATKILSPCEALLSHMTSWTFNCSSGQWAACKADLSCSAAELVYGTNSLFPGEFIAPSNTSFDVTTYTGENHDSSKSHIEIS